MKRLIIISLVISLVGLLLVGGVYYIYTFEDSVLKNEKRIVYNPATGERWASVEDYVYRDLNLTAQNNGK